MYIKRIIRIIERFNFIKMIIKTQELDIFLLRY